MQPTIIVGSGRCGSTMMSDLINQHPDILSISEFIIDVAENCSNVPAAFPREDIDGREFWEKINVINPEILLMVRHDVIYSEMIYPYKTKGARFNAETGVPALQMTMLPHLTPDHDAVHDELEKFITAQPAHSIRWHYENLFEWLRVRFDKKVWVERSGGSVLFLEEMLRLWPDAKYIHMIRDGMDTAYSMSNHAGYKLLLVLKPLLCERLGVDVFRNPDRSAIDNLPDDLKAFLPENFDREAFLAMATYAEAYGEVWLDQIKKAFEMLDAIPQDRLLTVSYDRFCEDPQNQLKEIVEFIGVEADPAWLATATKDVRRSGGAWKKLPQVEQDVLREACSEGQDLIRSYIERGLVVGG